ncbi:MAG: hypothetical protein ISF22_09520 [Methanomassiliicoccus sp.]|nr:hypothetical protein [Methanomassiliicoccus sp.]
MTRAVLGRSFDPATAERGAKYHKEGRVLSCSFDDTTVRGSVRGRDRVYWTKAWTEDGGVRSSCSCPVGENCKHGHALCLHWITDREACTDLEELKERWRGMEKDDLIGMLLAVVEHHPSSLKKVVKETALKVGGPGIQDALLDRITAALYSGEEMDLDPEEEIRDALDAVERLKGTIDRRAAAELMFSVYQDVVEAAHRLEDMGGDAEELAEDIADMFEDACQDLDDGSKDSLVGKAVRLFLHERRELEQERVVLALITPGNADRAVEEIDRHRSEVREMPGRGRWDDGRANRTAARVLIAAGKREEGLERLTSGEDLTSILMAVRVHMEAGETREALDLLIANRPPKPSSGRWAWNITALETLADLKEQGRLSTIPPDVAREVALFALEDTNPRSGSGLITAARDVMDATGGPGSFARLVTSSCSQGPRHGRSRRPGTRPRRIRRIETAR